MSELQITVNSRMIERLFFVFIILLLLGLNIYQWRSEKTPNELTAKVTQDTQAAKKVDTAQAAAAPEAQKATCFDGVKNQDETEIDCGGTCSGYWYDAGCHKTPQAETPAVECRLNSDCKTGFKCDNQKCVEIPPECSVDTDCATGMQCSTDKKCVEKQLTGNIEVNVLGATVVRGTGNNTKKVKDVQLQITNGKSKSVILSGKAYVYTDKTDDMYKLGKPFDIGTFKSGQSSTVYYAIDHMVSFPDDDQTRLIRIEIYDDNGQLLDVDGTLAKKIYP